ncbi:hypothetical protein ABPG75_007889 [Micractinium tetrahymenae]
MRFETSHRWAAQLALQQAGRHLFSCPVLRFTSLTKLETGKGSRWEQSGAALADEAAVEQVEAYQTEEGLRPVLTADDAQALRLLLIYHAATPLAAVEQGQRVERLNAAALEATLQLAQQRPWTPMHRFALAAALRLRGQAAAVPEMRAALKAAEEHKARWMAGAVRFSLAQCLLAGLEEETGGRWSLAGVHALLDAAARDVRHCRPWLPHALSMAEPVALLRQMAEVEQAQQPSLELLPGQWRLVPGESTLQRMAAMKCWCCEQQVHQLRRCSACGVAAYCSRACQLAHWRTSHKRECARLAAQQGGA